jgi:O-acetyl-ADP-ribose deacetylase (regulator of RNase III)
MEYIQGDITHETSGLIIHGVNCQGKMGSGVALAIKMKWPVVYTRYMEHVQGREALGKVQFIPIEDGLYIGNCWTQEFYGNDGKIYADRGAVRRCLFQAFAFCDTHGLELKTPKIAAGLAGLNWDSDVLPIFELVRAVYPSVPVKVYVI